MTATLSSQSLSSHDSLVSLVSASISAVCYLIATNMGRVRRRCSALFTVVTVLLAPYVTIAQKTENDLLIGSDPYFDTSHWDSQQRRQLSDLILKIQDLDGKLAIPDRPRVQQRRLTSDWSDPEIKPNRSKGERSHILNNVQQFSDRLLRGKRAPRVRGAGNGDIPAMSKNPPITDPALVSGDAMPASNPTDDDVFYYFGTDNIEQGSLLSVGKSKKAGPGKGAGKGPGKGVGKGIGKSKGKGQPKGKKQQQSVVPTISHAPSISNMPFMPMMGATSQPTVAMSRKPRRKPSRRPTLKPSRRPFKGSGQPSISHAPSMARTSGPTAAINVTSSAPTPAATNGTMRPSKANISSEMPSLSPSVGTRATTAPSLGPAPPGFVRCTSNSNLTCPDPKLALYCDKYSTSGSFQQCLTNCIVGYCCIHDSDAKRAHNCKSNVNCNFYTPCYIVWWKIQDTIGPAPYLRLKANEGEAFYGKVNDDDFRKKYLNKDVNFFNQLFGHHFLNDDKLPLTTATFDNEKYW